MTAERDYDTETRDTSDHKYVYGFDLDVMHPLMIRSFLPFFRPGKVLELGSFKGDFTDRLLPHFSDVTCVPERYANVVLTHVLEHIDDRVGLLRRINDEWLTDDGRLLLVCPNAHAPSRQIAVLMGLISHNAAITPAEAEHGHRTTYSLDTLERDAVAGGLRVVHRSGIFFKALANFQWDQVIPAGIVDEAYLDGCYRLGQRYPDLCSSIFLVCERGDGRP